ncbi:MAG: M42 family metallopeptidase [Solirubrobacteraceae bacterium]
MPLPDALSELLTAHGPSGREEAPSAVFRRQAEAFGATVAVDTLGTTSARVSGTGGGPSVAVFGHLDEIGLIVTHIDDKGFLWFTGVGGWDPIVLVGQRVVVTTRDGVLPGVVARKAIHLLTPDERKKVPELKELHIDIGAADGDAAKAVVRVGDVAVIDGDPIELPGERFAARSMDNRLGCFVALEAARLVAEAGGAPGDVIAVGNAQEETGLAGAATSPFGLRPDVAVVVDVTHATDVPGVDERELGSHALGSGPVLNRAAALHPQLFELLHDTAERESIPVTIEASGRYTGTDADAVQISRAGVPCALVSVPLRYMHSPVEMADLADVHACARLIAAFCLALEPGTTFTR